MTAPSGWYPNPGDPSTKLYWDGFRWQPSIKPPKRRPSPWWGLVPLVICAATITLIVADPHHSDNGHHAAGGPAPITAPTAHQVVYQLGGTAETADITIATAGGGTSQQQGVSIPIINKARTRGLRLEVASGAFLYISAQNNGAGTIICTITEDGALVDTEQSSGEFAIATCKATA